MIMAGDANLDQGKAEQCRHRLHALLWDFDYARILAPLESITYRAGRAWGTKRRTT